MLIGKDRLKTPTERAGKSIWSPGLKNRRLGTGGLGILPDPLGTNITGKVGYFILFFMQSLEK